MGFQLHCTSDSHSCRCDMYVCMFVCMSWHGWLMFLRMQQSSLGGVHQWTLLCAGDIWVCHGAEQSWLLLGDHMGMSAAWLSCIQWSQLHAMKLRQPSFGNVTSMSVRGLVMVDSKSHRIRGKLSGQLLHDHIGRLLAATSKPLLQQQLYCGEDKNNFCHNREHRNLTTQ